MGRTGSQKNERKHNVKRNEHARQREGKHEISLPS